MNVADIPNVAAVLINGFCMLVAVYCPKVFGEGIWSKSVFTFNFLAVMANFGALIERGTF